MDPSLAHRPWAPCPSPCRPCDSLGVVHDPLVAHHSPPGAVPIQEGEDHHHHHDDERRQDVGPNRHLARLQDDPCVTGCVLGCLPCLLLLLSALLGCLSGCHRLLLGAGQTLRGVLLPGAAVRATQRLLLLLQVVLLRLLAQEQEQERESLSWCRRGVTPACKGGCTLNS